MIYALRVVFRDATEKSRYLDGAAREDARDPLVLALVARLWHADPWTFTAALHAWCRDQIFYRHDPPPEEFAGAGIILARVPPADDCDGKALVFVAGCLAYGLPARIRAVEDLDLFDDGRPTHFQAEVWLDGRWVLAELTLAGVALGAGSEAARIGRSGEYIIASPLDAGGAGPWRRRSARSARR